MAENHGKLIGMYDELAMFLSQFKRVKVKRVKVKRVKGSAIQWEDLTDRTKLREYVDTSKKCKLQASGIIQEM